MAPRAAGDDLAARIVHFATTHGRTISILTGHRKPIFFIEFDQVRIATARRQTDGLADRIGIIADDNHDLPAGAGSRAGFTFDLPNDNLRRLLAAMQDHAQAICFRDDPREGMQGRTPFEEEIGYTHASI